MNEEILRDCLAIIDRVVYEFGDGNLPDRAALLTMLTNKFAVPENVALGGQVKTGQLGSLQNRPTVWPRTSSLFILLSPDQASLF